MPAILGYGAFASIIITGYEYTGGSLAGKSRWADNGRDEFESREEARKLRRRPIEQTIAEVGEGRGEYSSLPDYGILQYFMGS